MSDRSSVNKLRYKKYTPQASGPDLCSWRKTLQGFRFSEGLVDLSSVLHFLLVGEKIQSAFSTAMDPLSLKQEREIKRVWLQSNWWGARVYRKNTKKGI